MAFGLVHHAVHRSSKQQSYCWDQGKAPYGRLDWSCRERGRYCFVVGEYLSCRSYHLG